MKRIAPVLFGLWLTACSGPELQLPPPSAEEGPAAPAPVQHLRVVYEGLVLDVTQATNQTYRIAVAPTNGTHQVSGHCEGVRFLDGHLELTGPGDAIRWRGSLAALSRFGRAAQPGLELRWRATPGEELWGLGERFDQLNQHGKRVEMWLVDAPGQGEDASQSYFVTPVVHSTAGYSLFAADNPEAVFDLNTDDLGWHRYQRVGQRMVFWVSTAAAMEQRLTLRSRLHAPQRGIPDWAFGPWMSRNSYETQAEAEEALQGMLDRRLPVSVMVQEAWKGSSETGRFNQFSPDRWPDPQGFLDWCHGHGVRNILWQVPILHPASPHYAEAAARGYLVKAPDGSVRHRQHWLKGFGNLDFTHPEAVRFWQDLQRPLIRMGVHGFKADDGEDIHADDVFHDGRRGWEMHNAYSTLYNQALVELLDQEGQDGLLWARSGSLGIEQAPALWAGDQFATWEQLRSLLPAGLSSSLSGMPFWGHDIGGYLGECDPELYIRWLQFGTFSPLMQFHGIHPREPWFFGEDAVEAYRELASLRMNLLPTLVELGRVAVELGQPIMRPMRYVFPEDDRFAGVTDQYMLGPDLLVAPVLHPGARGRTIRFPAGRWHHLLYPVAFDGPSEREVPLDLRTPPVFVREGAELPVALAPGDPLGTWTGDAPLRSVRFDAQRAVLVNPRLPRWGDLLTGLAPFAAGDAAAGDLRLQTRDPQGRSRTTPLRTRGGLSAPANAQDGDSQAWQLLSESGTRLFAGTLYWRSPVSLEPRLNGTRYVREGTRTVSTVLGNVSTSSLPVRVQAEAGPGLTVTDPVQSLQLGPGQTRELSWQVTTDPGGQVGDLSLAFALAVADTPLTRSDIQFTPALRWVVCGPFPAPPKTGFHLHFPPEWNRAPDVRFQTAGDPVRWWALDPDHTVRNHGINFLEAFGESWEHAVAYAMTRLHSDREQAAELRLGSDDTLTVWFNGEQVHAEESYRLAAPDQAVIPVILRPGDNLILAKVAQDRFPWGMHFRLTGPQGQPIQGVREGWEDVSRYDPLRPVSDSVVPLPRPLIWQVSSPQPFDPDQDQPAGTLDAAVEAGQSPVGINWHTASPDALGVVDLNRLLGDTSFADAYATTQVTVTRETPVEFRVGSDDGITLWLNQQRILDVPAWRAFDFPSETVRRTLPPGQHRLVARIRQGEGNWLFKLEVWDLSGEWPRPLVSPHASADE